MPGLPGAASSRSQLGDCLSRHASASSRPPDPNSRMSMDLPDDTRAGLLAKVAPGDNSPPLSVSELSGALKRTIENAFGQVRVRGEISGFKRHGSGHCYFTLKDESACMDAVIWRGNAAAAGVPAPRTGPRSSRPASSRPIRAAPNIRSSSTGWSLPAKARCWLCSKRRRKALAAEGLFDPARKRRCRSCREVIGVVTSPTGAVIRDILHRLADRCPTRVILWPVAGAGGGRGGADCRSHSRLSRRSTPRPDLLIVARGGGSIEDLWPFNEEEVVRAAAECPIPLISAIGHETDTTLIDHASDLRAPTPTGAAEIAVPVRSELLAQLNELAERGRSACRGGSSAGASAMT